MRILNSLIVPKYIKGETLVSCKISEKNLKVGPFEGKKIEKKSHSAEKNCSKKFLAKARTRTRDRWVHGKPSTDEYT